MVEYPKLTDKLIPRSEFAVPLPNFYLSLDTRIDRQRLEAILRGEREIRLSDIYPHTPESRYDKSQPASQTNGSSQR